LFGCAKIISDDARPATPAKMVFFQFIPLFHCYWLFVALNSLAEGLNRTLDRWNVSGRRVSVGLAPTTALLLVLTGAPLLGLSMVPAALILTPVRASSDPYLSGPAYLPGFVAGVPVALCVLLLLNRLRQAASAVLRAVPEAPASISAARWARRLPVASYVLIVGAVLGVVAAFLPGFIRGSRYIVDGKVERETLYPAAVSSSDSGVFGLLAFLAVVVLAVLLGLPWEGLWRRVRTGAVVLAAALAFVFSLLLLREPAQEQERVARSQPRAVGTTATKDTKDGPGLTTRTEYVTETGYGCYVFFLAGGVVLAGAALELAGTLRQGNGEKKQASGAV